MKAFRKYTNTDLDSPEQESEEVVNLISRMSSEMKCSQGRNFDRSFYYLNIITEKCRATHIVRNCFGQITRIDVCDSSKGLPRFITHNIRSLGNLVIIIHEFKGLEN